MPTMNEKELADINECKAFYGDAYDRAKDKDALHKGYRLLRTALNGERDGRSSNLIDSGIRVAAENELKAFA